MSRGRILQPHTAPAALAPSKGPRLGPSPAPRHSLEVKRAWVYKRARVGWGGV